VPPRICPWVSAAIKTNSVCPELVEGLSFLPLR
jgi:hypothetical protein